MINSTFNGYPIHLIESIEELGFIRELLSDKTKVGLDTETMGLDYATHDVAGYCISCGKSYSPKDYHGFYIPVRHRGYPNNISLPEVVSFVQHIVDTYKTIFWNRNFDATMMEKDGVKIPFIGKMHDSQILAHLIYGESYPALKDYAKRILKWQVMDFDDNKAVNHDFTTTDPRISFQYAAGDPILTAVLGTKIWDQYPYVRKIYKLDNWTLEAIRQLSFTHVYMDYDFLRKVQAEEEEKIRSLRRQIFEIAGCQFNIKSYKDIVDVLSRFIVLTDKTEKGRYKVDVTTLEKYDLPITKLMVEYSHVMTALNNFTMKFLRTEGQKVRINYSSVNVSTGRTSSGGGKGNSFYQPINMQNVPKKEVKWPLHLHPELGFCLSPDEDSALRDSDGNLMKCKTKAGIREAFSAPEGYYVMSADYSGQEMTLAANFSGEPGFIIPMKEGKDIHNYVAKTMFNYENPDNRTKVKILNFSRLYMAEAFSIAQKLGITKDEAQELLNKYDRATARLTAWKKEVIKNAKRCGLAFTYFGRPRYLLNLFSSSKYSDIAFGERSAVNTTIQGCIVPSCTYVKHVGNLVTADLLMGKKLEFSDKRIGSFSYRGQDECYMVIFRSGDFCVCSEKHKFLRYNTGNTVLSISESKKHSAALLNTKSLKFPKWSRSSNLTFGRLWSHVSSQKCISSDDAFIKSALFRCWLRRSKLKTTNYEAAFGLRTVADEYGYNVVVSKFNEKTKEVTLRIKLHRSKKSKAKLIIPIGKREISSPTMYTGYQQYPLAGFIHKNTGGDLIRKAIVSFELLQRNDPDWGKNCILFTSVHDEVDLYVRKGYLRKAFIKIQEVMNFFPSNFQVPVHVDVSVGTNWGNCLDVSDILEDDTLIPKGYEQLVDQYGTVTERNSNSKSA